MLLPPMFTKTSTSFDSFRPITESDLRLVLKSVNLIMDVN